MSNNTQKTRHKRNLLETVGPVELGLARKAVGVDADSKKLRKRTGKNKIVIEFNEDSRKDFLTGFRKRKNLRRKAALDEMEKKERAERIRLRKKRKEDAERMKEGRGSKRAQAPPSMIDIYGGDNANDDASDSCSDIDDCMDSLLEDSEQDQAIKSSSRQEIKEHEFNSTAGHGVTKVTISSISLAGDNDSSNHIDNGDEDGDENSDENTDDQERYNKALMEQAGPAMTKPNAKPFTTQRWSQYKDKIRAKTTGGGTKKRKKPSNSNAGKKKRGPKPMTGRGRPNH